MISYLFLPCGTLFFLICASDVAALGVSDGAIKIRLLIVTRSTFVAHSYSSVNHFYNDLISTIDLRSYNC